MQQRSALQARRGQIYRARVPVEERFVNGLWGAMMGIAEINRESLAAWRPQGIATTIYEPARRARPWYGSGDLLLTHPANAAVAASFAQAG